MQQACTETFPAFRRYMAAKARALGLEKLAWYDVSAPLGGESKRWSWAEAEQFIITNFGRYSERMANFAKRTFDERWIDAGQRVGKVGGAYCAPLRAGESRVLMNYNGSFNSVSTLAHELGHAYHNLNMEHRLPLQRSTPSTLAETASIFCETLAFDGAMAVAAEADQLVLLDTVLERNLMVVVDIHSRFLFEKSVFAKRAERELTITEFKELMTAAQIATYGEDMECLHPFMWAVKGHYYGPTFYNYPYTFGLLFGLGLYAKYQQEPEAFRADYDNFLSSTGMADAVTLGQRFGADVESVDFWRSSLRVITRQIEEFEGLVG
jgi:oligoendopeptidase F